MISIIYGGSAWESKTPTRKNDYIITDSYERPELFLVRFWPETVQLIKTAHQYQNKILEAFQARNIPILKYSIFDRELLSQTTRTVDKSGIEISSPLVSQCEPLSQTTTTIRRIN